MRYLTFIFITLLSISAGAKPSGIYYDNTFDAFSKQFYAEVNDLAIRSIEHLSLYNALPVPDGEFGRHVDIICSLPLQKKLAPTISKLILKKDPHLQEAGVLLATALSTQHFDFSIFHDELTQILSNPDLDSWVLEAINIYAHLSSNRCRNGDCLKFHMKHAEVAYFGKRNFGGISMLRSKGISPYHDAQMNMEYKIWVEIKHSKGVLSPISKAVLPYFTKSKNYTTNHQVEAHFKKIENFFEYRHSPK